MNRHNQILTIALAVQIVIAGLLLWRPWQAAAGSAAEPLVSGFTAANVARLTISDGDDNRIALAKQGDVWVLPEAGDYPVDSSKVAPLLEKLEELKTDRLVTQTSASHQRLQVANDDFSRLVEIELQDGTSHKIYLGSSAGGTSTHVRADDRNEVYLTNNLSSWDVNAQAASWIDPLYFTVPQTATVALVLENPNGTFEFEKEGEDWVMQGLAEDEKFNPNSLTSLLSQASSVQMTTPIGTEEQPDFGLEQPQAVVTLKTQEGDQQKDYVLRIGAKSPDDNSYVASSSESPYYVRVAEFTGNNFVEKSREDFLELPPTPMPEPGAVSPPEPGADSAQ
jgi:YD repeat-containing protein